MLVLLAALVAFNAVAITVAGLLAYIRNPERALNWWFGTLTGIIGIWTVLNFIDSNVTLSLTWADLVLKLDFSIALFMGWAMMPFVALLTRDMAPRHFTRVNAMLTKSAFLVGSIILDFVVIGAIFSNHIFKTTVTDGSLRVQLESWFPLYLLTMAASMGTGFYLLLGKYFRASRAQRRKLGVIVFGLVVAGLTNIATNLVIPNVIEDRGIIQTLNLFGYAGIGLLVFCTYLAITTRKLFDIRLVVVRSLTYATLIAAVGGFYTFSVFLIGYVLRGGKPLEANVIAANLAVTLFVAATFQYLRKGLDWLTGNLFFRNDYDVQGVMGQLNAITTSTLDLDQLALRSSEVLEGSLKSEFLVLVLFDRNRRLSHVLGNNRPAVNYEQLAASLNHLVVDHSPVVAELYEGRDEAVSHLRRIDVEIAYPLYANDMLAGYILLGPKKNGTVYVQKDLGFLKLATASLSVAIQNALRFEEIENFNATLQEKIDDATRKLRRTNEKLRQIDETKDDFISMASHQLRTPLTSVKGYVSMVLEGDAGKISSLQRKLLNQAFISSQRMVYLISDLLNVSRLRTGKFIIEPVPTDLSRVVQDEVDQLAATAKGRNLQLVYDKPEHFPVYMLDETKLRQVIMNFIDNAIYYTPSGGHITVKLEEKPKSIEFRVVDDGIGVPKSEQHHLFSKFYRARNAKQARPDGTGLGLFMAKKVVLAQGGATTFHSQPGKGSVFGFVFAKERLQQANSSSPAKLR